jgi:threonine/homoserine/homoserine lactone efflux protein
LSFFKGLLFGMTLQISIGPIFFAILHKSITESRKEALLMTVGVALVDALYIALSFTGVALLLNYPLTQNLFLLLGSAVLICFGISYWSKAGKETLTTVAAQTSGASFTYGLKLTAINPLTILFWSGAFGGVAASGILNGPQQLFFYALGCIVSTILFLGLLSILGPVLPLKRDATTFKILNLIVGSVLVVFGLLIAFKLAVFILI